MNMQKKFKCGVAYILAFVVFFTNIPMSVQAVEHESMEIDVNNNIWEGNVAKKFASGDGTVSNPYIISNGAELRYFADEITNGENFYNKYIDISDDIYLNDVTNYSEWSKSQSPQNIWEPIGGNFAGTLDGNGHSIVGVYINSNEDKTGFFRELSLNSIPTIKNIQLKNIFVAGESQTGGLVGHATFLDCTNVTVMGKISGKDSVGGFVGDGVGRRITGPINFVNCSNYASVEGKENKVGGIIGNYSNSGSTNDKILINNCRNSGSVSGNEFVGGLGGCFIAETDSQGIVVSKSINEGTIGGCSRIGGIIGEIDSNMKTFEISQVCNFGNISATEGNAGGIVGVAYVGWRLSKMDNLYNTGKVSGTVAGGLAGYGGTFTYGSLSIQNFYNLGEISGKSKSYEGIAEAEIAGWGTQMITMENAYYEKEKNLNANAIVTKNSVELDRNQFLDTNSFKGFDFDNVWTMSGYGPIFQWQLEEQKCGENAYWSVSGDVDNLTLKISGSGDTFDYDVNEQNPWFYKYKIKNVIIGDDITSIGAYLFAYDSNIKTVKLGKSIDKIKENAFLYCNNLAEISVSSSLNRIDDNAFRNCSGLTSIELLDGIISIGQNAFFACDHLTILCKMNSYAYNYAIQNKIAYRLIGEDQSIQFTIGRDNNLYDHIEKNFYTDADNATYKINSSKYLDALLFNQSPNYRNRLIKMQDNKWEGDCFGMSAAMVYAYKTKFDIKSYLQEESEDYPYFCSCKLPIFDDNMLDLLNTFQLSQFRSDIFYTDITYKSEWLNFVNKGSTLERFLKGLVQLATIANYNNPFLLGSVFENSGHCVVVLGLEESGNDNYYKIAICDPNGSPKFNDEGKVSCYYHNELNYLMVKKDYTECYYANYKGEKINGLGFDSSNFKEMKYFTLEDAYSGHSKRQSLDSADCVITISMDDFFSLKTDDGKYLSYDGNEFQGNLNIEEILTILNESNDGKTYMSLKLSDVKTLEFSHLSRSTEIECLFNDTEYIDVSGKNLDKMIFNEDEGVQIEGSDAIYQTTIASQDKNNTLLQISGITSSKISFLYDGDNIKMSGATSIPTINKLTENGLNSLEKSDPQITFNNPIGGNDKNNNSGSVDNGGVNDNLTKNEDSIKNEDDIDPGKQDEQQPEVPNEQENIRYKISAMSKKLAAGTKVKLSISTKESTLDNTSIIWCSSNKSYATINKKGVVNCKKAGIGKKVTITAKSADGTEELASITFKIMKNAVTGVKIKKAPKTLKIGESANLKAVVTTNGNSANTTLKWTSSNTKYVTVSKKGKIIAKRAGNGKCVVITVTSTDGSDKKTSIKVKVK